MSRGVDEERFRKRRDLFLQQPYHPLLNNHSLTGDRKGQWSINLAGGVVVEKSGTAFATPKEIEVELRYPQMRGILAALSESVGAE